MSFNQEDPLEDCKKFNRKVKNINSTGIKISRAKLTKSKTSKNFTKFKISKVMLA